MFLWVPFISVYWKRKQLSFFHPMTTDFVTFCYVMDFSISMAFAFSDMNPFLFSFDRRSDWCILPEIWLSGLH